jgi:predicted O-methyltransferase YrrM
MKLVNAPNQARNVLRGIAGMTRAETGELNRSLGVAVLALEGYCSSSEQKFFRDLVMNTSGIRNILEVGFNAGHSAHAMLSARQDVQVTSFDLGAHSYTAAAGECISRMFPGRHRLVIGDSRETLSSYRGAPFDMAFIDGGHDYEVAASDLVNAHRLLRDDAVIVMDDMVPWKSWGAGPTQAWGEAVARGDFRQVALYQDGRRVRVIRRKVRTSAWAVGTRAPQ